MFIKRVNSRFVKNSRGEKTIEIVIETYEGKFKCSAPSGKSTGRTEVIPWHSKGIETSMKLLKKLSEKLINKNFMIKKINDIKELNNLMLKIEAEYGKLGGNVWYVLEGAFLKAAAKDCGKELWQFINDDSNEGLSPKMPMPVGNCIGGGLHSKKIKGQKPDFQEFLLIGNEKTFGHAATKNIKGYWYAKKLLKKAEKSWVIKRNDEGAWRTALSNEKVLEILKRVAKRYKLRIGTDAASSSFYKNGYYNYKNKALIRDKIDEADYIIKLIRKFGIFFIEDGMDESDFSGFKSIMEGIKKSKRKVLNVGDDLTTTHIKRVQRAVRGNSINATIIKPNQVGSILEVKKVVEYCKKNNITMIFSHRSGETMDNILADYCVGFGGNFMKAGIFGKERLVKAKRVIDIEKSLL